MNSDLFLVGTCRQCLGLIVLFYLLVETPGCAHASCPNKCLCIFNAPPYQVLCEQAGLEEIPSDLPPQTEHLSFRKNSIKAIPSDAFRHLHHLKRLVLDGNRIRDISPYAFRGLSDLEELSVQDNLLTFLATNSFANLTNVTNLFIGYNKITAIEMNAFCNTQNIRSLSLIGNPLKTTYSGAFAGLQNVGILYLPSGIKEIEPDTFRGLSNVSMLRLVGMQLETLPEKAFRGLTNVSSLTIRDSNISYVKSRAFYGLKDVEYLTLENNNIDIIEGNALQGIHAIGVLAIHNNRIRVLEPHAFDHTVGHVNKVRFVNNSLGCDCRLRWVAETHLTTIPGLLADNLCMGPEDVASHNASAVYIESLVCTTPPALPTEMVPIEDDIVPFPPDEPEAQPSGEMLNTANTNSAAAMPPILWFTITLTLLGILIALETAES